MVYRSSGVLYALTFRSTAASDAGEVDQVVAGSGEPLVRPVEGVCIPGSGGRRVRGASVGPDADRAVGVVAQASPLGS